MNKTKKNIITNKNKTNKRKNYSNKDYNSGDGMLTAVWGPSMWHVLHTISFNYPVNPTKKQKKHYKDFILSLKNVLPCKYCRINLKKNFKSLPLTQKNMKNRKSFSLYVYKLHEHVNKMLKKKSGLSYKDVKNRYEHFRARCTINEINSRIIKSKKTGNKKEKGCVKPLYGKKSKCIIKIVPQDNKSKTFQMDKKCERFK